VALKDKNLLSQRQDFDHHFCARGKHQSEQKGCKPKHEHDRVNPMNC